MSNVYTRNRKKTPFDVLANAEKLQDLVTLYVMNERYVPKKWRFMKSPDATGWTLLAWRGVCASSPCFIPVVLCG